MCHHTTGLATRYRDHPEETEEEEARAEAEAEAAAAAGETTKDLTTLKGEADQAQEQPALEGRSAQAEGAGPRR